MYRFDIIDSFAFIECYESQILRKVSTYANFQIGSEIKLESANRMYIDKQYNMNALFQYNANQYLASQPEKVNFSQKPNVARQRINNWVESKTNQKIKDFLPAGSVNSNTKIVLVNAIYFKGKWLTQFDTSATNETGEFTMESGQVMKTPMMYVQANFQR